MGKYTKRWEERKPHRPQRPLPPFAYFLSNYSTLVDTKGPQLLRDAGSAWKNLENEAQVAFKDQDAMELYKKNMADYRRVISAMKRPPGPYALYVKQYWRSGNARFNGTRQHFHMLQKNIAADWKKLSEDEQDVYRAGSTLLTALFEAEQGAVLDGDRNINLNWQNAGLERIRPMLYSARTAADNAAMDTTDHEEEEDQDDEEDDDYDGMGDIDDELDDELDDLS